MYVIFPAEEVVYFTYGIRNPLKVHPRPTLDHLPAAHLPRRRTPDIFDYRPDGHGPPRQAEPDKDKPKDKAKRTFLRLGRQQDPEFGRTLRSPLVFNYEQPAPLSTPAFSKKNIFDRDFDALFEVAHVPEFSETVRVVTPEAVRPSREQEEAAADLHWELDREDGGPEGEGEQLRVPPLPTFPPPTPPPIGKSSSLEEPSRSRKGGFFSRIRHRSAEPSGSSGHKNTKMASAPGESVLRDLTHPSYNEHLKNHNSVSFKLVKTVSDFTSQLSQMYEQQAGELQMLVATYRKKNGELRKERPTCPSSLFHTWETLLQEVEADSQARGDVASALARHVSRPLVERTFHRKLQSRKLFAHREGCDTIIAKTEEKLAKCRQDYKVNHQAYCQNPSPVTLASYMDGHNVYVQQLHATNGMLDEYNQETLPLLLQELEEIYSDLCNTLSEAVLQGAEVISSRATQQARRYESLGSQCRALSGTADLAHLARALPAPAHAARHGQRRPFAPPVRTAPSHDDGDASQDNTPPVLRNELVLERLGPLQIKSNYDSLKKEALDLELQIKQLQDTLDTMTRMQQRSLDSNLYNKVNELQEDISLKKFDLRVAQMHLSAVKAQKELFAAKADAGNVDRKLSASSAGSMKTKWLKAFKSLKPAPPPQPVQPIDKKNGNTREISRSVGDSEAHNFLEYTYKKITPCDVCSQVLRGHTRQGLRCRLCKMNVHADCMGGTGRCQTKARMLRRQKSTSEMEARGIELNAEEDIDPDGWLPGQRLLRQLSFKEDDDIIDEMGGTGTRPFGQPLCFVRDDEEPPPAPNSKRSIRRK